MGEDESYPETKSLPDERIEYLSKMGLIWEENVQDLDKAVEAMHNALGAMADVDRNNGDRGVIAVLNEYGFRPLLKELEKADQ